MTLSQRERDLQQTEANTSHKGLFEIKESLAALFVGFRGQDRTSAGAGKSCNAFSLAQNDSDLLIFINALRHETDSGSICLDDYVVPLTSDRIKLMSRSLEEAQRKGGLMSMSILSGVISRLGRNAPDNGEGYGDFNPNYIQVAAAASGGSLGSPVVNIDGLAVALQAGGRVDGPATDYFLPLDRPLRALQCIREGKSVGRGTIQTQWMIKAFDECRRFGLTAERESKVRAEFPNETGMLVAEVVLPMGSAYRKLEEGDALVRVNGELLNQFVRLDAIFHSSVGQNVKLLVQRGGKDVEVVLDVGDLHAITPDRFVSVAGAAFHNLS